MSNDLAVVILTYNEEMHIERAIKSVQSIASEIFVIDSGSKDKTVELAEKNKALVLVHPFVNQAKQFNWALDNAPITANWIMRLDADEIIESDLQQEIQQKLPHLSENIVGINLKRKHIFMDRWVRFGGRYPLRLMRIWRTGHGRVEDRWMDEHVVISNGETITFNGGFLDCNLNDLTFFTDKHNKYATREAIDVLNQKYALFTQEDSLNTETASFQASLKRNIKEKIYNKLPFTISALLYFLWRYIFQLGFLDGRSGLVYHFLQGYWYRFLVGAKIMELERAIVGMTDKKQILVKISELTGHKLSVD
ncbi:glycosyltransferase family 2 protein [Acinetobacter qingfengensis]|uniref:Glycosyl transferase n=1 Tax=Acinetobacter qingfengensis TaxID=1262585 RepID=A0A1E7RCR2_9GAMM|nr:glycosyltransferase family 2 protein [Acinetobacter qingfengensis]KAA8732057.1 glycosyltransferase family 2 protein [Acinetobacter qingfengensis]OEY97138.1 glycosyl transferase [Acinetobacter qingfengensis]